MLLDALGKALGQLTDPRFRAVLWRAIGFTLMLYAVAGALAWRGIGALSDRAALWLHHGWLHDVVAALLGVGAALAGLFLILPIAALFIGVFLDDVAEAVETRYYPADPPGRELSIGRSLAVALRFLLVVVAVNLACVPFYLFLPGPNALLFYAVNAYLIGREYFEMVGYRHLPTQDARRMRRRHWGRVFLAGLVIALPLSIPVVNLIVPIVGTAFMVHVYKALARREGRQILEPSRPPPRLRNP